MSTIYPKAIQSVMEASKLIEQAGTLLTSGGGSYNLERLGDYARALFDRFAPFRVGDRVTLTRTPNITAEKNWGWMHAKHWMVAGIVGTVVEVDYLQGGFCALVCWDGQTWKNAAGEINPVSAERLNNYNHWEDSLARLVKTEMPVKR